MVRKEFIDLNGKRFGKLTVLKRVENNKYHLTYWLCKCDCGKEVTCYSAALRNGKIKSCGCYNRLKARKPKGVADFNRYYHMYKHNAKIKGRTLDLTRDEVMNLSQLPCYYCGEPPNQVLRGANEDFIFNGIDRVDSNLSYTKGNSVPCCHTCNIMKRDYSKEEFLERVKRIAIRWNLC